MLSHTHGALLELGSEDTYLFEYDGSNSPLYLDAPATRLDAYIDELPDIEAIIHRSKEMMHLSSEVEETALRVRELLRQTI